MRRETTNRTWLGMGLIAGMLVAGGGAGAAQMSHEMGMTYDRATEVTLTGTVDDVMTMPGTSAMSGTHIALRTTGETIHVHLGPTEAVAKMGATYAKGDRVTVTGSRIKGEGFEAILARTVRKGSTVVTLRDEDGTPRWSQGR